MSDSENTSNNSSERSDIVCWDSDEGEKRDYFVAVGSYAPYRDEPLARNHDGNSDGVYSEHEETDEDNILPSVLEQRFNREITVDNWCTCGNCDVEHLVGYREFRCCFEVAACTGKFTFDGVDRNCILNHSDYAPLTHKTVLLQAGPLLRNKAGKYYKQMDRSNNAENKFLRAVSYRWLARWLFGCLGWENTRPLPACVYHNIRTRFIASETKGYLSGQERANVD